MTIDVANVPTGQDSADLDELIRTLQSSVWTLAYAGTVPTDQLLRVRHAAHLLAAATDRMLIDSAHPAPDAGADDPQAGLAGLIASLASFGRLAPLDRGRLAPQIARAARAVLVREWHRAMAETGLSAAELAEEYGMSVATVRAALTESRSPTQP